MKLRDRLKYHVTGAIERGEGEPIVAILPMNKANVEKLYLFYFNDFLTVERFAEYHGMSVAKASRILAIGMRLNHRRPTKEEV